MNNGRRPTVRDVAREAGVSPATVSNVLNYPHRVKPAKLAAVQDAIQKLDYVPSESARHLRSGRSHTIGLLLLDAWNPSFGDMARGVEDVLTQDNWTLIIGNSDRSVEREKTYLSVFEERQVAGIIFVPKDPSKFTNGNVLVSPVPVVAMDATFPQDAIPSVSIDDVAGGESAMQHLLDLGHRDVVFIGDPAEADPIQDRLDGVKRAINSGGAGINFEVVKSPLSIEGGVQAAEGLLKRKELPTAIIAAIDLIALGAIQKFQNVGVKIPEQLSICGYDDMSFSSRLAPPLTTVHRPHYDMGRVAAQLLTAVINDPDSQTASQRLVPSLAIRSSTRKPGSRG